MTRRVRPPEAGIAVAAPPRGGDLLADGVRTRERATGPPVPVPHVVEVALERVHDPVKPGGQLGRVLLDGLVGLIDDGRVVHSSKAAELEASPELKHRLLAV